MNNTFIWGLLIGTISSIVVIASRQSDKQKEPEKIEEKTTTIISPIKYVYVEREPTEQYARKHSSSYDDDWCDYGNLNDLMMPY